MFLDEKVYREAVLMKYIARETNIPVPKIICYGKASENPTGLGPFIIMTWVEGRKLSDVLRDEDRSVDTLNPNIDPDVLKRAYDQMARIMINLWSLDFDKIGPLGEETISGRIVIDGPPLTQEVNELIRASGIKDPSPQKTYQRSSDYIKYLLDLQSVQLEQQRNGIYNSEDCRNKYACRQLMKAIAMNFIPRNDDGPFKLFCDDFGPGNVLVNDSLEIVAVIDWEFCYAAPPQFAASIPWWLLLRRPDYIVDDIGPGAFFDAFLPKANIFLQALEEQELALDLSKGNDDRLSLLMRQSLEDRSAWFMLACRKVASVDLIYWDLLDEYCWGPRSSMAQRAHAFTGMGEMHKGREYFVRLKIQQLREYHEELGEATDVVYEPPPSTAAQSTHETHIQVSYLNLAHKQV
jgi:aminoglycoside phosphotransferase (APT) family kinase protein